MGEEAWDCIVFFFGTERESCLGVCFGLDWKEGEEGGTGSLGISEDKDGGRGRGDGGLGIGKGGGRRRLM